jgi:predicted dehydrogenase
MTAAAGRVARVALVGLGVRGRQWLEALRHAPAATAAAVVERDPDRAAAGAPTPAFASLAEALAAVPVDAVIVATPPAAHGPDVLAAVGRGLPVLCEKPLSEDLDEAVSLVAAASAVRVPLLVGMNFRHLPVAVELRRLVRERAFGEPLFAQLSYIRNRDGRRPDLNDHPLSMRQPMLLEQSIHHLDLVRWVYGSEVASVSADTWNPVTSTYRDDACVAATLRLERGPRVQYLGTWTAGSNRLEFRWRTDFERGVVVQTDQFGGLAAARLDPDRARTGPLFGGEGEPLEPLALPPARPFVDDTLALLDHFAAVVHQGREPGPDGLDHLATLALVHACWEAAAGGARVELADFRRRRGIPDPP